jgi:hypothetical protein
VSRPLSLGVLKGDANESLACARWHAEKVRQHAEWLRTYLLGPALKASIEDRFKADVLLAALHMVEEQTKVLQQITQEAPGA